MELYKDDRADVKTPEVFCDVKNCVHHNGKNICTAQKINVGPVHAISSTDTACATFKPAGK